MPDIGERTYPINPIWPTKPGERPAQRKRPKRSDEREQGRRERPDQDKHDERPRVDDYA